MRRRERRGAGALLLSLSLVLAAVLAACIATPTTPTPAPGDGATGALAREAAALLLRLAAYDYALAGHFAGERARVVTPDRYVVATAADAAALVAFKDKVTAQVFADPRDAAPLVQLADAVAELADALARFAAIRDADAFAAIARAMDGAWVALRAVAAVFPAPDPEVQRAVARGPAWRVTPARGSAYAVVTAPLGARAGVYPDRDAAQRRVAELRDAGIVAAVAEEERYTFGRAGPDPAEELWREGALDLPTADRARHVAFVAGGVLVAHDDGALRIFDEQARLRWSGRTAAGTALVAPSPDGRLVAIGGALVGLLSADGRSVGGTVRLPSPATTFAWTDASAVLVVGSPGATGRPEGGAGSALALSREGAALEDPFPLVTPAAGPLLAAAGADVYVATTTRGATDVELLRPGTDATARPVARIPGQHQAFALAPDAARAALVTAEGTFRFAPRARDPNATLERVGDAAREVRFGKDGTLYVLWRDRLVAYDEALRPRWSVALADGRRVLVARRLVVQDGILRVLALDPRSGAAEDLAVAGPIVDLIVSADGARAAVLAEGRRVTVFQLP